MNNMGTIHMKNLEQRISGINNYCYELTAVGGDIFDLAQTSDRNTFIVRMSYMARETRKHISNYQDADAFFFYDPDYDLGYTCSTGVIPIYETTLRDFFSNEANLSGNTQWSIVNVGDSRWFVHIKKFNGMYFGGCFNLDKIESEVRGDVTWPPVQVEMNSRPEAAENTGWIQVSNRCGAQNLYLHISIAKNEVLQNMPILQRNSVTFSLIGLLCAPILLLFLQLLVINPLKKVVTALNLLKRESATRIHGSALTREFDEVYRSFNGMAEEMVELKISSYEQILEKQRLELSNLHLQMNPHFLMNTFNIIFNLAQMAEYKNIQTMVLYLSDYFRYINTRSRDFTTVAEELNLTRKYLEIAGIQYINRFEVEIDIDPQLCDYMIPPLFIHNFVENIMKHGISLDRVNHVSIRGQIIDEKMVEFIIEDDGRGMPAEQAENLSKGIFEYKDQRTHIGIQNAYKRMQYVYSGKGSLHIRSDLNEGVTVRINLPLEGMTTGQ